MLRTAKTSFLRCTGYLSFIKKTYKARFTANSSSCTTIELSKLLNSCLNAVKTHVIRYCKKVYERSGKKFFWFIKNSGEVINKLKLRGFRATSLSTYDISTLYTTQCLRNQGRTKGEGWSTANQLKPPPSPPPPTPSKFIAGRPKAALLFWFFGDF